MSDHWRKIMALGGIEGREGRGKRRASYLCAYFFCIQPPHSSFDPCQGAQGESFCVFTFTTCFFKQGCPSLNKCVTAAAQTCRVHDDEE